MFFLPVLLSFQNLLISVEVKLKMGVQEFKLYFQCVILQYNVVNIKNSIKSLVCCFQSIRDLMDLLGT